jgi:hypothetical protein
MLIFTHENDEGRLEAELDGPPWVLTLRCDAAGERAISHKLDLDEWDSLITRVDSMIAEDQS